MPADSGDSCSGEALNGLMLPTVPRRIVLCQQFCVELSEFERASGIFLGFPEAAYGPDGGAEALKSRKDDDTDIKGALWWF